MRMAIENPRWGYTRIRGALANLGHEMGRNTVKRILFDHGIAPAPERGPAYALEDLLTGALGGFETQFELHPAWCGELGRVLRTRQAAVTSSARAFVSVRRRAWAAVPNQLYKRRRE